MKGKSSLHSEKCYPLKSFQELSLLTHETYKGKVLIVCYITTFSTTHAVCWDLERKRILDSEYKNNNVFTYTSFDNDSQLANTIVAALSTTINVPCIFSIAYWKDKSTAKRKRWTLSIWNKQWTIIYQKQCRVEWNYSTLVRFCFYKRSV